MKKLLSCLCLAVLALTGASALAETYAFDLFSIDMPDEYITFTRDNANDEHPYASMFDMNYIQSMFEADPTMYFDAYTAVYGFDLVGVVVDTTEAGGGMFFEDTSDLMLNTMMIPALKAQYEAMGATVLDTGILRGEDKTYIAFNFSVAQGANTIYTYQFYTMTQSEERWYGITFKIQTMDVEISEEMIAEAQAIVETAALPA